MNDTLVDSNSDEELDITGIHNEEVLDKQSLTGYDCWDFKQVYQR